MDFNHLDPLDAQDIAGMNADIQQVLSVAGAGERAEFAGMFGVPVAVVDQWATGERNCIPEEAGGDPTTDPPTPGHRIQTSPYEQRLIFGAMASGSISREPLYTGKPKTGDAEHYTYKQEVTGLAQAVRWVYGMRQGGEDSRKGWRLSKAWTGISYADGNVTLSYNGMAPADDSDPFEEGANEEEGGENWAVADEL